MYIKYIYIYIFILIYIDLTVKQGQYDISFLFFSF